jgi:pyruvate/2-oxoglutarate dehydrogenase complex dihydrolipoamide acyltransferase (E2) component
MVYPVTTAPPVANAKLSPAARHLVESQALDASSIRGSSKGGRIITKGDVLAAVKTGTARKGSAVVAPMSAAAPASSVHVPIQSAAVTQSTVPIVTSGVGGTYTDIPNSNMRKVRIACLMNCTTHHDMTRRMPTGHRQEIVRV